MERDVAAQHDRVDFGLFPARAATAEQAASPGSRRGGGGDGRDGGRGQEDNFGPDPVGGCSCLGLDRPGGGGSRGGRAGLRRSGRGRGRGDGGSGGSRRRGAVAGVNDDGRNGRLEHGVKPVASRQGFARRFQEDVAHRQELLDVKRAPGLRDPRVGLDGVSPRDGGRDRLRDKPDDQGPAGVERRLRDDVGETRFPGQGQPLDRRRLRAGLVGLHRELVEPVGGPLHGLVGGGPSFHVAGTARDDRGVVVARAVVEDGRVHRADEGVGGDFPLVRSSGDDIGFFDDQLGRRIAAKVRLIGRFGHPLLVNELVAASLDPLRGGDQPDVLAGGVGASQGEVRRGVTGRTARFDPRRLLAGDQSELKLVAGERVPRAVRSASENLDVEEELGEGRLHGRGGADGGERVRLGQIDLHPAVAPEVQRRRLALHGGGGRGVRARGDRGARQDAVGTDVAHQDVDVFINDRGLRPVEPRRRAGRPVLLGAKLDQQFGAGDRGIAVHDHEVGGTADLEGLLVVHQVFEASDLQVVGAIGRPLVVEDLDVALEPGADDLLTGGLVRPADRADGPVEVESGHVAGRRLVADAVARLTDHGEPRQLDGLALVEPLIVLGVHPEPALGVVDADRQLLLGLPGFLAELEHRQRRRLA